MHLLRLPGRIGARLNGLTTLTPSYHAISSLLPVAPGLLAKR